MEDTKSTLNDFEHPFMERFIPVWRDVNTRRWMLFVDGENFTIRGQELAQQSKLTLKQGIYWEPNVLLWLPGIPAWQSILPNAPVGIQPVATRAYYYTSSTGDEQKLNAIRETLWGLGFHPEVFKKKKQETKSKGVDIALAKDFLCNAFLDNYDAAVLIAGDADYIPIVNEVKRLGKLVYVIFFHGKGLGLSRDLQIASDVFFKINDSLIGEWQKTTDFNRRLKLRWPGRRIRAIAIVNVLRHRPS